MDNFCFYNPVKIHFGRGEERAVGQRILEQNAKKVLLVYGGGSIKKNGVYDSVTASLKSAGIDYIELGGVKPNPMLELVERAISICRENAVDFILAVGGGSVIDTCKATACGVRAERPIWEYFIDTENTFRSALPIGVVLTMPAAGSESSDSAVLTDREGGFKRYTGSNFMLPKFAILNPEITFSMSKFQIACGAMDIFAHLMERYFTPTKNVLFTDNLIEAAMRTILEVAPKAIMTPTDYDTRAELMWCGTVAHNNLLNTGRMGDWASHDIEHELSGIYDIAHGEGLAAICPAWMKYVAAVKPERMCSFAVNVFGIEASANESKKIMSAISKLEDWIKKLGLKNKLSQLKIDNSRFVEMAEKCVKYKPTVGQYVRLGSREIKLIYDLAL